MNPFFLLIVTYLPGVAGQKLRFSYYKKRLKRIGNSCTIVERAVIENPENVSIGDYTVIDNNVTILGGVGVEIGRRVHIAHNCLIQGGGSIKIGDYVGIAANSMIFSASDTIDGGKRVGPAVPASHRNPVLRKPVIIERDAFIGAGCIILPGVTVGEGAVVGAGSLVTKDLPAWNVAMGSPAKPIRKRPRIRVKDI